jgi:hypothetical protein
VKYTPQISPKLPLSSPILHPAVVKEVGPINIIITIIYILTSLLHPYVRAHVIYARVCARGGGVKEVGEGS